MHKFIVVAEDILTIDNAAERDFAAERMREETISLCPVWHCDHPDADPVRTGFDINDQGHIVVSE